MTTNCNQQVEIGAAQLTDEAWEQDGGFPVLSKGYLPDDSDPAWPSKSGQAD